MSFQWVRVRAAELEVSLKQVFDVAGIDYQRGYRIVSNFLKADPEFTGRIQAAFHCIEEQKHAAVQQ